MKVDRKATRNFAVATNLAACGLDIQIARAASAEAEAMRKEAAHALECILKHEKNGAPSDDLLQSVNIIRVCKLATGAAAAAERSLAAARRIATATSILPHLKSPSRQRLPDAVSAESDAAAWSAAESAHAAVRASDAATALARRAAAVRPDVFGPFDHLSLMLSESPDATRLPVRTVRAESQ